MSSSFDFTQKNVVVLGYGVEGRAIVAYLLNKFPSARVSIADASPEIHIPSDLKVEHVYAGVNWLDALKDADVVLRSPGVSYARIRSSGFFNPKKTTVTSITEIFLDRHRSRTIGVTGTKGKSTTSSLLFKVLGALGYDVRLIGNIGMPAIELFDEFPDYFIYELSSYQLQDISTSPHVCLFLNIYPEHLDHHGDFDSYFQAKMQICAYQDDHDICVHHSDIAVSTSARTVRYDVSAFRIIDGRIYSDSKLLYDQAKGALRGDGNLRNIQAVYATLDALGVDVSSIADYIYDFTPLQHRLQVVRTVHDITFINDSISTVPQATLNALNAYKGVVRALVLGGYDRGVDYYSLAKEIVDSSIPNVFLFLPSGKRIFEQIHLCADESKLPLPHLEYVTTMDEVVTLAIEKCVNGGVCLLSPASPSFGLFKNFEERGLAFISAVSRA